MDFGRISKNRQGNARGRSQETDRQRSLRDEELIHARKRMESVAHVPVGAQKSMSRERQQIEDQERIREQVAAEFISPDHIDDLEQVIRSTNTIIGFRAAGAATLAQMAAGAVPKPHTILDKSLKAGEFETADVDTNVVQALAGLVPYRKDNRIKGLHLSSKGIEFFQDLEKKTFHSRVMDAENDRKYLECDPTSAGDPFVKWLLDNLTSNPQFEYASWFVTGDYDLHDMVLKTSQGAPVPSDSLDEARILTRLSDGALGQPRSAVQFRFVPNEFSPIQHGPQYNYIAHMMDKERGAPIVSKVADLDLKIALFDGENWTILDHSMPGNLQGLSDQRLEEIRLERRAKQAKALEEYYKKHGLKLKWIWRDTPEANKYIGQL